MKKFGTTLGDIVLGLIWALWHLPIMLAGYNYPEHPVLGALLLLPALVTAASFLLVRMTLKAGSFWPAVLIHGSINSVYQAMIGRKLDVDVSRLHIDALEISVFAIVAVICRTMLVRTAASGRQ